MSIIKQNSRMLVCVFVVLSSGFAGCIAEAPVEDENNNNNNIVTDAGYQDATQDAGQNNQNNNNEWQPPLNSRIYVNTQDKLFYIDPGESQDLVEIGDFSGECTEGSGLYDIALDENSNILGIAAEALYEVDKDTAECTLAFEFPEGSPHFFSLSYVKGVDPENPDEDKLIASSASDGEWVLIDWPQETPQNLFVHLGYYDPHFNNWKSSGDIVSVQTGYDKYVTYATVECGNNYDTPECDSDWLAIVDPEDGYAQIVGKTGYRDIFALGFWGDRLYGFTNDGEYITIDIDTGEGTLEEEFASMVFWGAGNTTIPYIVQ